MKTHHANDRIVNLLTPSFLTKRPVDLDAVVSQLQSEQPSTSPSDLRGQVCGVAKLMGLRVTEKI